MKIKNIEHDMQQLIDMKWSKSAAAKLKIMQNIWVVQRKSPNKTKIIKIIVKNLTKINFMAKRGQKKTSKE